MIKEEKDLLLKDLCARLPYNVVAQYSEKIPQWFAEKYGFEFERENIVSDFKINYDNISYVREKIDYFKPYLRPMSSMTDEESEQIIKFLCEDSIGIDKTDVRQEYVSVSAKVDYLIGDPKTIIILFDNIIRYIEMFDWLNARHFDYRGLIEKGLALEAPEGMYNFN